MTGITDNGEDKHDRPRRQSLRKRLQAWELRRFNGGLDVFVDDRAQTASSDVYHGGT